MLMLKRYLLIVSAVALVLALIGCAPSKTAGTQAEEPITTEEITTETTTEETTTEETTVEETTETTVDTEESDVTTEETTTEATTAVETTAKTYILNTSTKKIHSQDCSSVAKIKDKNKAETTKSIEELEKEGYEVCKNCYDK